MCKVIAIANQKGGVGKTMVFPVTAHDTVHDAVHVGVHELVQCRIFFQSNPSSWCRILTLFWRDSKWENKL